MQLPFTAGYRLLSTLFDPGGFVDVDHHDVQTYYLSEPNPLRLHV